MIVVSPRGFCAGVVRAVDIVELALQRYGSPVYMCHQIVHNQAVVTALESRGAVFVEAIEDIPEGSRVIFSAHGSPPEQYRAAEARKLSVIDATCPLVTKVHNEARKYARDGKRVLIIGHRDHVEVKGSLGQAQAATPDVHLVDPDHGQEIEPDAEGVVVLTQTTLSRDDVAPAVEQIRQVYPDAVVRDDICYATTNRQEAVKTMAEEVDLIIVVGSDQSSNSRRLAETSRRVGCPAYLVPSADAVPWFWVRAATYVGVTSGASTPERLVEEVVATLEASGATRRELEVIPEDVSFKMPEFA